MLYRIKKSKTRIKTLSSGRKKLKLIKMRIHCWFINFSPISKLYIIMWTSHPHSFILSSPYVSLLAMPRLILHLRLYLFSGLLEQPRNFIQIAFYVSLSYYTSLKIYIIYIFTIVVAYIWEMRQMPSHFILILVEGLPLCLILL